MNKLLITALISLFAVGTASADYATDINSDTVQASTVSTSVDFNTLPATAAGRPSDIKASEYHAGMQDHPSR
ncbi:MAG: hypothetical protein OQL27_04310 [Sedimenticola sp.]|nr:hypothetical protein [Sedimenticola sp.]